MIPSFYAASSSTVAKALKSTYISKMKEALLLLAVVLNVYLLFRSFELTGRLHANFVIDERRKKDLRVLSLVVPIFGFIITYLTYKKTLTRI